MKQEKMCSKKFTKGFTLLELLVVVLIIGILAGIALPQHKKAVEKSKASQGLTLIKAISESIKSYHLTTGHYPTSFEQLDIDIPESFDKDEKFIHNNVTYGKSNKDWNISIERYPDESAVTLYMIRISGRYQGAGFVVGYSISDNVLCLERTFGANYLFNSNLSAGAYCEKLMGVTTLASESVYGRAYYLN